MARKDEVVPTVPMAAGRRGDGGLRLLVFGDERLASVPLPARGALVLGRAADANVVLDHPSISRRHARIDVGPPLTIEDLGSANGTRVREQALAPGVPVELAATDVIELGALTAVLQGAAPKRASVAAGGAMAQVALLVDRVAKGSISVLLLGETGAGKEVMAETIHRRSPRAGRPLVKLNCAALSETLLESELFGHEKGAFTGATQTKPGLLETAEGGTVFLDEVGELTMALQVKLLRVLEERQVLRVGAVKPRAIDVRFVAATNRDLEAEAERGAFRRDLYFRLAGVTVTLPPLRERKEELAGLARAFVAEAAAPLGHAPPSITAAALERLHAHDWPGNVRELRNAMERAVLLSEGAPIEPSHLPLGKKRASASSAPAALKGELEDVERRRIEEALAACQGNQTRAAKMLGMSRGTFLTRLERYGFPRPRRRGQSSSS